MSSDHSFETIWLYNQKTKITIQYDDRPDTIVKITFLVKNPIINAVIAPNIFGSLIETKDPKSSNKTPGNIMDGKTTDGTQFKIFLKLSLIISFLINVTMLILVK